MVVIVAVLMRMVSSFFSGGSSLGENGGDAVPVFTVGSVGSDQVDICRRAGLDAEFEYFRKSLRVMSMSKSEDQELEESAGRLSFTIRWIIAASLRESWRTMPPEVSSMSSL